MKDFQKKVGTQTVFTVHDNKACFVQHRKEGMQTVRMPITSLLQVVSDYIQHDISESKEDLSATILGTPYINRAIQHGASIIADINPDQMDSVINALLQHEKAHLVTYHRTEKDVIISARTFA